MCDKVSEQGTPVSIVFENRFISLISVYAAAIKDLKHSQYEQNRDSKRQEKFLDLSVNNYLLSRSKMKFSLVFVFVLCVLSALMGQTEARWKGWKKIVSFLSL